MSRPSGTLQTDLVLSPAQTKELRERFEEISSDLNTGGTPILTAGLKYNPITMSATDSEIIATYRLTKEDIASIFRVPLALIGDMEKATFGNTESLMRFWVASGLGFIVEHLENTLDRLFDLPANESIEFDTDFLLQADFKGRMEGYKVGVTGGFITPNEIRLREGFKPLEGGNTLYMQMQNVPIDLTGKKLEADIEAVEVGTECARDCGGTGDPEPEPVPNEEDQAKAIAISKSFESDLSFLEQIKIK
jgi:phage portal protein BeeE